MRINQSQYQINTISELADSHGQIIASTVNVHPSKKIESVLIQEMPEIDNILKIVWAPNLTVNLVSSLFSDRDESSSNYGRILNQVCSDHRRRGMGHEIRGAKILEGSRRRPPINTTDIMYVLLKVSDPVVDPSSEIHGERHQPVSPIREERWS